MLYTKYPNHIYIEVRVHSVARSALSHIRLNKLHMIKSVVAMGHASHYSFFTYICICIYIYICLYICSNSGIAHMLAGWIDIYIYIYIYIYTYEVLR
jgi:hypothetical protein